MTLNQLREIVVMAFSSSIGEDLCAVHTKSYIANSITLLIKHTYNKSVVTKIIYKRNDNLLKIKITSNVTKVSKTYKVQFT